MTMTISPIRATRDTTYLIPWADEVTVSAMARMLRQFDRVPTIGACNRIFAKAGFPQNDINQYGLAARVQEFTRRRAMGVAA